MSLPCLAFHFEQYFGVKDGCRAKRRKAVGPWTITDS